MANVRIERIASAIQEEVSMILMMEIKDEQLKFITITGCELSSDLSYAKIYFTVLDQSKKDQVEEKLNNAKAFIRSQLSEKIDIRHTPELTFIYDESIEYGRKIEDIIDQIHEKE